MPFDNTPEGRLTLADLSWRLRNPDTWPPGFEWDYNYCNDCAMGLAWQLSGGRKRAFSDMTARHSLKLTMAVMADAEMKDFEDFADIFVRLQTKSNYHFRVVTPNDVADAIDRHLAARVCV